jgi:2-oxo-4-hydroxy-4-carboxy-5-ureidoimidazoline decarboxylase
MAVFAGSGDDAFVAHLDGVFEHAPWVAQAVLAGRPFATADALHVAMMDALRALPEPELVALLRGHPELAGAHARSGAMTADSVAEQGGLALASVDAAAAAHWDTLNAAYRARFGFPFILCIRRHSRASALRAFERRLANDRATELQAAQAEIGRISRLRLADRLLDHDLTNIAGRLSAHVLDLTCGRPAQGLRIELMETGPEGTRRLVDAITDADGGTGAALLEGAPLRIGRYELRFHVAEYFSRTTNSDADEPFLDVVPVAFGIDEPEGHYHLPLAVTPWAYSTYRGS